MTRKTKLLTGTLTLAVAAVGAAGLALHAHAGMDRRAGLPMAPVFASADANDDGAVTREELRTFVREQVSAMDADGDGSVSEDEFEDALAERRQAMIEARFQQLDANGDGALSPEEFRQARSTAPARALGGRRADDRGEWLFYRLDANDDDTLQTLEATSFAERVFARADANADGRVTQEELEALQRDRDDRRRSPHTARFDGPWGGGCR
jgi:Ca2+-binding EF-hand superfamily protein